MTISFLLFTRTRIFRHLRSINFGVSIPNRQIPKIKFLQISSYWSENSLIKKRLDSLDGKCSNRKFS